jgi:UBX domain-containing protein 1
MVFGLAQEAPGSAGDGESEEQVRRTITMVCTNDRVYLRSLLTDSCHLNSFLPSNVYRVCINVWQYQNGFIVDDGPYRRLDDPANADFLRSLAMGRTPRELMDDTSMGNNIVVGLIDKRSEDFVEPFRSFSGAGATLGSTTTSVSSLEGVFDPQSLPSHSAESVAGTMTNVAVRLPSGKRKVVTISLNATVQDLAILLRDDADGTPFRLVAGFPPQTLTDASSSIEAAGLKGAQISMHKA